MWVVSLWLAAAACGTDTSGITELTGDAANGQTLYEANCQGCHGASGNERAGAAREAKESPDEAAQVIRDGDGEMPAFGEDQLSDQEVADLLAYLKTL